MSIELKAYAFVSELARTSSLAGDDLLMASKLNGELGYQSVGVKYVDLSSQLAFGLDEKISSLVEDSLSGLSSAISSVSGDLDALSVQETKCESAIVKVANCLQETMQTT